MSLSIIHYSYCLPFKVYLSKLSSSLFPKGGFIIRLQRHSTSLPSDKRQQFRWLLSWRGKLSIILPTDTINCKLIIRQYLLCLLGHPYFQQQQNRLSKRGVQPKDKSIFYFTPPLAYSLANQVNSSMDFELKRVLYIFSLSAQFSTLTSVKAEAPVR